MIEFSKINPFEKGQRASFEEFVCQLARHEKVADGSFFKRVEGSGGDGGVECYWTQPDGMKLGYQAKYFLKCGDIDWKQIDQSVSQAVLSHPELKIYVIALPCDLTDQSGLRRQRKTGWQLWEDRVVNWKAMAAKQGLSEINFEAWTASELVTKTINNTNGVIGTYFFGEQQLDNKWFENRFQAAAFCLDDRYHPEDHVEIEAENLGIALSRDSRAVAEICVHLDPIMKYVFPSRKLADLSQKIDPEIERALSQALAQFDSFIDELKFDPSNKWPLSSWLERIEKAITANRVMLEWALRYKRSLSEQHRDMYSAHTLLNSCSSLDDALGDLKNVLKSKRFEAEQTRFALVSGSAGTGKSHLMARLASQAIEKNNPAVLILGQTLNSNDLFAQLAQKLGCPNLSGQQVLGLLDTAGKAAGVRALLLIDAINEGAGSRFWRDRIGELIHELGRFSHICCIVSCREEYVRLACPQNVLDSVIKFQVHGFLTAEEQRNAAKVYLDKRGIVRPSTPWLAPEFINPLFLRTMCISLEREGVTEIPKGLSGTVAILEFYLRSMGQLIAVQEQYPGDLSKNLVRTIRQIALAMLNYRADYLELDVCRAIVANEFRNITPQSIGDWLSVLLQNSLLRLDPHPSPKDQFDDEEVVRFSFQRFQDYFIVDGAISRIDTPEELFQPGGKLDFCIVGQQIHDDWVGLIEALSTLIPEKFGTELVDVLPGGAKVWWSDWDVQPAFVESVKWRLHSAFTDRTRELLNCLDTGLEGGLELLIQVSLLADHPWNAELLHRNLIARKLPDRDAFWTVVINRARDSLLTNIETLFDWCLHGQVPKTESKNQYLAAMMLCWFFTSTNRFIRDKSTKALAALLLKNVDVFPELLDKFKDVDDPYILERLLGAAYGAACLDPQKPRLRLYANAVFGNLFKDNSPPFGILLRDYAFGIVELAKHKDCLPAEVDFDLCQPPYLSKKPILKVSEQQLNALAAKAGGTEILESAAGGFYGDFSRYEIDPRIEPFMSRPLSRPTKLSTEQVKQLFQAEVIGENRAKLKAYEAFATSASPYQYGPFLDDFQFDLKRESPLRWERWEQQKEEKIQELCALLKPNEVKRFEKEILPFVYPFNGKAWKPPEFDPTSLKRWIAHRAYMFGWTKERFGNDSSGYQDYTRNRPNIERIGKKYQWLALDELLCRLADNYWLKGRYEFKPKPYCRPPDLGFERDIDPTILAEEAKHQAMSTVSNTWALKPLISLEDVPEERLPLWPFERDPTVGLAELSTRTDDQGVEWLVVYEHFSRTERYAGERRGEHSTRMQEFRFVSTFMAKAADAKEIAEHLQAKETIDIHHWPISETIDEAYLYETSWRATISREKWKPDSWRLPTGIEFASLAFDYGWESHLDASLPNGYRTHIPAPWLFDELKLIQDTEGTGVWRDDSGEKIFQELRGEIEGGILCLLRKDAALRICGEDHVLMSVLISERNAWPGGSNKNAAWRRGESVWWEVGSTIQQTKWCKDTRNGTSAKQGNSKNDVDNR